MTIDKSSLKLHKPTLLPNHTNQPSYQHNMSEQLFKSFAIIGAGPNTGIHIVKAFLAIGAPILVIARPASTNVAALPADDPNLKVVRADYTSASEISTVLREHKVDVLISTVTLVFGGGVGQNILADAAKEAGVKLFVPSEFGIKPQLAKGGLAFQKTDFAVYAKSIGLPTLRIFNGLFYEFVPWLTALTDTGYVAHILTTQPPSRLLDVEIQIEGQRATLSEIGALYKGRAPVVYCDALPTEGVVNAHFRTFFQKHVGVGGGSCGWNPVTESDDPASASRDNSLWEGHHWLTVSEALEL
jgi:NAD(P)-dependent dehydrogenase (short-subunit alcohol dehydrogenase family)